MRKERNLAPGQTGEGSSELTDSTSLKRNWIHLGEGWWKVTFDTLRNDN